MDYHLTRSRPSTGAGILAFLIPAALLMTVYIYVGIAPFGDRTMLCSANSGWFETLRSVSSVLNGNSSLMYDFSSGLGAERLSEYTGSILSPMTLLAAFFDDVSLPSLMSVTMIVRAAFAGLFAYFMLSHICGGQDLIALGFAVAYGSGSMMTLGFLCPQYADAAVMLPLAGAGTALLCERGSVLLLGFAMSAFAMGSARLLPLLLIFVIVFFSWYRQMWGREPGDRGCAALMILCCVLSSACSTLTLIPYLLSGGSYHDPDCASLFDNLAGLFAGASAKAGVLPLMFTSSLTVLLVVVYALTSRLPLAERQIGFFSVIGMITLFSIPAAAKLLTGLAPVNGAAVGAGFVVSCFAAAAAVRSICSSAEVRVGRVLLAWIITGGVFALAAIFGEKRFSAEGIIFTAAFITLYSAMTLTTKSGSGVRQGVSVMLLLCIVGECLFGGVQSLNTVKGELMTVQECSESYNADTAHRAVIASSEAIDNGAGLFRTRGERISGYSSVGQDKVSTGAAASFMEVLGTDSEYGFTPVVDDLLGVRYLTRDDGFGYPALIAEDGTTLYKNTDAMPVGFAAGAGVLSLTGYSANPFEAQNQIMSAISGTNRTIFSLATVSSTGGTGVTVAETTGGIEIIRSEESGWVDFTLIAPADGALYMNLDGEDGVYEQLSVNGNPLGQVRLGSSVKLGSFYRGDQVLVTLSVSGERLMLRGTYFATISDLLLEATVAEISGRGSALSAGSAYAAAAAVNLEPGQVFMTTIPWNKGWKAYVDGKETETRVAAGAFIAVMAGEGAHTVELKYRPDGVDIAVMISLLAAGLMLILAMAVEIRRRRSERFRYESQFTRPSRPAKIPEYEEYYDDYDEDDGIIPELVADLSPGADMPNIEDD